LNVTATKGLDPVHKYVRTLASDKFRSVLTEEGARYCGVAELDQSLSGTYRQCIRKNLPPVWKGFAQEGAPSGSGTHMIPGRMASDSSGHFFTTGTMQGPFFGGRMGDGL